VFVSQLRLSSEELGNRLQTPTLIGCIFLMISTAKHFLFFSKLCCNQLSLELYTEFLFSVNNLRIIFCIKTCFYQHEAIATCLGAVFDCTSGFPLPATIFTFYSIIRKTRPLHP